nr:MAG TPA: Structural protein [Crassvirales sp.]
MATFSVNQVRQLYVATSLKTPHVLASDAAGSIAVKNDTVKSHLYFEYKGADNLMRSDLIDTKNILYAKATDATAMAHNLKSVTIALDSNVNGGAPVAGQDYILRIAFKQYVGMSDEDQYFKYGMVHAYAGMSASEFYKVLAVSLVKNFSREIVPLIKIEIKTASATTEVTPTTKVADLKDTYTGVVVTEVEQPWRLGVMAQTPVYFTVQSVPVTVNGDERHWATLTESTSGSIGNGKTIADLEYFCMGERGDQYRQIGWPHNIPTTYLVDPTKTYCVFDIHYAYVGSNESVQKSEKTITIVCADKAELNKVITAFNTATGLSVATL